jgi:hypothetical protein
MASGLGSAFRSGLLGVVVLAAATAQVPSPLEFLGHEVGADYQLCNYKDMVRYFRELEAKSDRVRLIDIGPTSYGQRMLMAVVSAPANLARLERLRGLSVAMAHGKVVREDVDAVLDEARSFVWIDAGLHSTEAIAGQNIIELLWQMTSRDDAEVRRILDEVVLLACPVNPDGYELVCNAYRATRSMTIPVLYQRWIGHDNNRDFYACNQLEAQNVNRVFYREWCPQIVYNHHQTAPRNTIIFTPPFRDPHNYLVDPMVVRGIEIVSAHMNQRFAQEGKPGVISRSGAPYSGWWNGGPSRSRASPSSRCRAPVRGGSARRSRGSRSWRSAGTRSTGARARPGPAPDRGSRRTEDGVRAAARSASAPGGRTSRSGCR